MLTTHWADEAFLNDSPHVTQSLNARALGKVEVLRKLLGDPEEMFEIVKEENQDG